MTAYSILEVTPTDDAWIPSYLEPVAKIIEGHGGRYVARTTSHEIVEGDREQPGLRVILEWPNREAALAFVNDPAYAPYKEARQAGSVSHHAIVDAVDDLA